MNTVVKLDVQKVIINIYQQIIIVLNALITANHAKIIHIVRNAPKDSFFKTIVAYLNARGVITLIQKSVAVALLIVLLVSQITYALNAKTLMFNINTYAAC